MASLEEMPPELVESVEQAGIQAEQDFGFNGAKFFEACSAGDLKKAQSFFDSAYSFAELIEDTEKQIEAKAKIVEMEERLEKLKKSSA